MVIEGIFTTDLSGRAGDPYLRVKPRCLTRTCLGEDPPRQGLSLLSATTELVSRDGRSCGPKLEFLE